MDDLKRLEIANICYANVAGCFASFTNSKYRDASFKWSNFPDMMLRHAPTWMYLHSVSGNAEENNALASKFAYEIATTLLEHSEFLENDPVEEAILQEREACAKLCETASIKFDVVIWQKSTKGQISARTAMMLADKIREKKNVR